jgi:hypothetical protein
VQTDVTLPKHADETTSARVGTIVFCAVVLLFVGVSLPVVLEGAPLADDFVNCLEPQRAGLGDTLAASFDRLGALRRAHLLEIVITTGVCQHLPFGVAIAVPLALTLAVALLLRGLLRDLGAPGAWPSIAGALWLLQPLGSEAALWPAAMHVALGLSLALAALRLHRDGRHGWGMLAVFGACLSIEQVLLALPLAIWLTSPPNRRRRAIRTTVAAISLLLVAFLLWPGSDPRLRAGISERILGVVEDPLFLIQFPAVGLGLHSIPLAVLWAFPASALLLACGGLIGSRLGPALLSASRERNLVTVKGTLFAALGLIAAINVPVVFSLPHQGSPRLFAPTWLVVSGTVAFVGPFLDLRRLRVWGTIGGVAAAGALLSLALSVWVRVESASFTAFASKEIARALPDDASVAVCGITRTVVQPAPRGAFAVHEFVYDWAAREALDYYTGKTAEFTLAGEPWGEGAACPDPQNVDMLFAFPDLVLGWHRDA